MELNPQIVLASTNPPLSHRGRRNGVKLILQIVLASANPPLSRHVRRNGVELIVQVVLASANPTLSHRAPWKCRRPRDQLSQGRGDRKPPSDPLVPQKRRQLLGTMRTLFPNL